MAKKPENSGAPEPTSGTIAALTAERDNLLVQRRTLERELKALNDEFEAILRIVQRFEKRHRPATASAAIGIPSNVGPRLTRDLSAGSPKVTKTELAAIFPALSGPTVDVTRTADTLLDTETEAALSAMEIASA